MSGLTLGSLSVELAHSDMSTQVYISSEKKKELESELHDLKGPKRQAILDALMYARSLGDLSENAEYHNAREEQARLEERIGQIENILKNAEIVTAHQKNEVSIGSTVTVKKKGEKDERVFVVVGSEEADMGVGKVSHNSPIGGALMGKKKGETVCVKTPKGETEFVIVEIK